MQPIRSEFAQSLSSFLADREDGEPAFSQPEKTAKMLRDDLAAARESWIEKAETEQEREDRQRSDFLAYRDHSDRVADFHALRHTFISNLANGGVHPKDAQALARHSTITLTMDRYTHTARGKLATALEALPDLRHDPAVETSRATGTHDGAETYMSSYMSSDMPERGTPDGLRLAAVGTQDQNITDPRDDPKSLCMTPDRTTLAPVGTACQRLGAGGLEPPTSGLKGRCSTD